MNDSNYMWQIWIFGWIKVRFWLCLRLKQDEMEFMFIWCNKNFLCELKEDIVESEWRIEENVNCLVPKLIFVY